MTNYAKKKSIEKLEPFTITEQYLQDYQLVYKCLPFCGSCKKDLKPRMVAQWIGKGNSKRLYCKKCAKVFEYK